jgi:hypothetical protein
MQRATTQMSIAEIKQAFVEIDFPEYQREPDIWSRDQKQRLIDSIFRQFDISSIYMYRRDDGGVECIDGRQRLNAIVSFLGDNESDATDNGFPIRFHNEIGGSLQSPLPAIDGQTFAEIQAMGGVTGDAAVSAVLDYQVTVVYLSDALESDEFNLQFLRLNLGALINAGEKLNAMVGGMRDVLFDSDLIGHHPFLDRVKIPTRRFAKEQAAAQVLLQVFAHAETGEFARARHFDLQRFVKEHADVTEAHPLIQEVARTMDALQDAVGSVGDLLRNRAIAVTVILFAWVRRFADDPEQLREYIRFLDTFLLRLRWQVGKMKDFEADARYDYLVEFQRHVTQASVEKPAVARRQAILDREFDRWIESGDLTGDAEFKLATGQDPPVG